MRKKKLQNEYDWFSFLNSLTPDDLDWVRDYFAKQGMPTTGIPFSDNVVNEVLRRARLNLITQENLKAFARKMQNAWRVRMHRKHSKAMSLTISLESEVMNKLSEMSHGQTKTEIISKLIEGSYPDFLNMKREIEQKKADAKEIARRNRATNQLKKMMVKPTAESSITNKKTRLVNDLEGIVSILDEMIAGLANK